MSLATAVALAGLVGAAPPVTPAQATGFLGRSRAEVRLRDLYGVVRIRLAGGGLLEDGDGPYLLLRYEVRNARSRVAEIHADMLQVRTSEGEWLAAEGLATSPPLAAYPLRPSLASREVVRVPRDDLAPVYASFRTPLPVEEVDPVVVFRGRPHFLRGPRATRNSLGEEALRAVEAGDMARAEGLLQEAARQGPDARLHLGRRLLARAEALRRADRPVEEDRVLRLALPYAPNPAFVQARLAELRRRTRRRLPQEAWAPPRRDWAYHRRRAEQYRIERERPPVPVSEDLRGGP